ncbi:spore cortex biosynthesis protein YabQ [Hydrogenoanaerobacterium saccharovorans]|uniref:Spore cortex biosynthesis protein YabQ n=1 Tax=Hydrogenoanaerobacterium saccharovorans TaxID=474960 RepID=A0A1H7ZYC8_9FIRM|nr:spore cortex biosynthesis protein YabQ [Hydrogenoanaerobacterium saccharovorans]RPF48341.1 spore cortex biosynthesis protein YabQ [Hydrogenoanaerobacterium saccharovorans]SEM62598.1 spore cortex biosynthesis protein YabQ [Hydrogenoanaerobacterium saccharovorans]
MIEVNTQTIVFLQSLMLGFALGLFYDVFRIFRLAIHHSSAIIFLEDISYFATCAVITFLFSLSAVNGHVRVFLVIGELLGATIYYFSLGALVMSVSKLIIRFIKALLRLLYRLFLRPFVQLFIWLARKLTKVTDKIAANAKKVRAKAKYSLKQRSILVYNLYVKGNHRGKLQGKSKKGGVPDAQNKGKGKKQRKRKKEQQSKAV